MKHIEEKDGKVFIDGVEYIPKETEKELPTCYADIIKRHNYIGQTGYTICVDGSLDTWNINHTTRAVFSNAVFAKAMLKLKNLLEIRDEYNDGWKPDWCNRNELKYSITIEQNELAIFDCWDVAFSEFIFKSRELAQQFLNTHKEDIEFVFKYLYMWNN